MAVKSAYVIGSGPNGLTAAIILQRAGFATTILEAQPEIGGGMRSAELTLPGFTHDLCSAIHPLAASSPVFKTFPLKQHGLEWVHPVAPLAHPLPNGDAAVLFKSVEKTAELLGEDGPAYRRAVGSLPEHWEELMRMLFAPILRVPRNPLLLARFGLIASLPALLTAKTFFRTERARLLYAGMAAHSILPLTSPVSGAFGWVLGLAAHGVGWPMAKGGSQSIANALASYFESLGGQIAINTRVDAIRQLRDADLLLCDVTPRQLLRIAGDELPTSYRRKLEKYHYGPGAFKVDYALSAPIPWKSPDCALAGTVHLGASLDEVAQSEQENWDGVAPDRPFVLLAQQSLFDPSRAPAGQHTAWAYCHVPNGSTVDMLPRIEAQIERFAPGFSKTVLARSVRPPNVMEEHDANLVGGDINGGSMDVNQFIARPTKSLYHTPRKGLYLCSSSTPPGGGVHGLCGYFAAKLAIAEIND